MLNVHGNRVTLLLCTGSHKAVLDFVWMGGNKDFPITAPPAIKKGDFVLCNTPVVMSYLNTQFGWDPESGGRV